MAVVRRVCIRYSQFIGNDYANNMNNLDTLLYVEELLRSAGAIVRTYHDRPDTIDWKGANDPVTAADHAVNAYLVEHLAGAYPDDGILAEESKDDLSRRQRSRVWCIDPLDGTKEFIARNGEFAIMVGLAVESVARLGVVFQPIQDYMYSGICDQGSWMTTPEGRRPLHVSDVDNPSDLRLVVSRSHRNPITDDIKASLGLTQERISGSVGLKCGLIACADADLYLHPAPGTREWDTCAPEAILTGAGGKVTDCWGRPLRYSQPDVRRRRGLVASNSRCHGRVLSLMLPALRAAGINPDQGW